MSVALSRAVMTVAVRSLDPQRAAWALAMQGELEIAIEDGKPLSFAIGCLLAAWREMPMRQEGRFVLAAYALVLGLVVPLAALSMWAALLGYPYLAVGRVGVRGFLAGNSDQLPLLNAGDWAAAPPLTFLMIALAAAQLLLAWFLLKRDWTRVAAAASLVAATLTTLVILMGLLALDSAGLFPAAAGLITEALALLALARWHDDLPDRVWLEMPSG